MHHINQLYIDGQWVKPSNDTDVKPITLVNPSTEHEVGTLLPGSWRDVDLAVGAAKRAFASFSKSSRESRFDLLGRFAEEYKKRQEDLSKAIEDEIGCPQWLAAGAQYSMPLQHLEVATELLEHYDFETPMGRHLVKQEPIGVCGLITPWNWPILQIMIKLAPAIATGCTIVWKPSEYSSISAMILAEIVDAAEFPPGVFNMIFGCGADVGRAISSHRDIAMISVTGSTRAGVEIAQQAAPTLKRVHQELGGKGPSILLEDADFEAAVSSGVNYVMLNSGQNCTAPTRLLVPRHRIAEAEKIAVRTVEALSVGPERDAQIGPVANINQWNHIQRMIQAGIAEGAKLVHGGPGRVESLEAGYFVKPTIFSDVHNSMAVAQEEIFGPVVTIIPYSTLEEAISIANDSPFGLASYVHSADHNAARAVAGQLVSGQVFINGDLSLLDINVPFGGRKMSGNGREFGAAGFEAFTESVSYMGYYSELV